MNVKLSLSILESTDKISKDILKLIVAEIQQKFSKSSEKIQNDLQSVIHNSITIQPEYQSLKNGELQYNFGIANTSVVDSLVDRFVESITYNIDKVRIKNNQIDGRLVFSILSQTTLEEILSSSEANVLTEKGSSLPWLKWLLLSGADPLILEYKLLEGKKGNFKGSRTGKAIMIRPKSGDGSWSVPPAYAGTIDNNWITRAIDSAKSEIENVLSKHIN